MSRPGQAGRVDEARVGDLLVFYGSLLRGLGLEGEPEREPGLSFVGPCRVAGELYLVGPQARYPGLRLTSPPPGARRHRRAGRGAADGAGVLGEAWRVESLETLAAFDAWELGGYSPDDAAVPYRRVRVRLLEPDVDAWVYEGLHPDPGPVVVGGDWRAHVGVR